MRRTRPPLHWTEPHPVAFLLFILAEAALWLVTPGFFVAGGYFIPVLVLCNYVLMLTLVLDPLFGAGVDRPRRRAAARPPSRPAAPDAARASAGDPDAPA